MIITAASPSRSDVGDAIDSASDGDTVIIPSGLATWASALNIVKAITLQGAGIGNTIISDGVASGVFIKWVLVANLPSRMTGIEFRNNGGATFPDRILVEGVNIDSRTFRLDHCFINDLATTPLEFDSVIGVVDHNTITLPISGVSVLCHVKGSFWNGVYGVRNFGDGAWAAADQFGTNQFLFFEDNVLTNKYVPSSLAGMDAQAGGRYVFRFNTVTKLSVETHGSEAERERSGRAFEVYGNTFIGDGGMRQSVGYFRGGNGLFYNNAISDWGAASINLLDNRQLEQLFSPFGGEDGRNPWDVNSGSNPLVTGTASSAGALMLTDSGKSWTTDQWAGYTLRHTSGKTVSSLTRSGSTCTVMAPGHGYSTGDIVSIFGANQYAYNSRYSITVVDANTFTFTTSFTPATPATGTIRAIRGQHYGLINSNTGTQLTFQASLFGAAYDMQFTAGDTFEINKVTQAMDQCGATGGSNLGGVDMPTLPGAWNNQSVSAWYEWNNLREGGANVNFTTGRSGPAGSTYSTIVENVHYFNNTPKPGYTPFTYPHPLVSAAAAVANITTMNVVTLALV